MRVVGVIVLAMPGNGVLSCQLGWQRRSVEVSLKLQTRSMDRQTASPISVEYCTPSVGLFLHHLLTQRSVDWAVKCRHLHLNKSALHLSIYIPWFAYFTHFHRYLYMPFSLSSPIYSVSGSIMAFVKVSYISCRFKSCVNTLGDIGMVLIIQLLRRKAISENSFMKCLIGFVLWFWFAFHWGW